MTAYFHQSTSASYNEDASDPTATVIKNQPIGLRVYLNSNTEEAFNPDLHVKKTFHLDQNAHDEATIKARLTQRRHTGTRARIAGARLNEIKRMNFRLLKRNSAERFALEYELETIFHTIYADLRLNGFNRSVGEELVDSAQLLEKLIQQPPFDESEPPEYDLTVRVADSDKPAKYVALKLIAPWVADAMVNMNTTIMEGMEETEAKTTQINAHRLNWVWGGGLDMAILSMLPDGVGHTQYTTNVLTQFSIGTGYMSFVLYYFRLGLNLSLLIQGTLKGSWMDPWRTQADKDLNISLAERFRSQWQQRKFMIINDAFWATANLACFMYLIGNGLLGYIGVTATAGLLLMDVALTIWGYRELEADHIGLMAQYDQDIIDLNDEILNIRRQLDHLGKITSDHVIHTHKLNLEQRLAALPILIEQTKKNQAQCEFDWKYTNKDLYNNLVYACVLSVAFGLICCSVLYPPLGITAANALILGLVGAAISCIATMSIHAKTATKEIEKSHELIEKATHSDDKTYQEAMLVHNQWVLAQKIVSDVLLPAAVFALLVFAPTGFSLPILIPIVVVLLLSGLVLEKYKPQPSPAQLMLSETLDFESPSVSPCK